ncbi:MAG: YceI family protein [Oceanicaulis sp.]
MRRLALASTLAAFMAAPAFAQDWTLDQAASRVAFEATAFGSPFTGAFEDFSADITLDPDNLDAARIEAVVRAGSAELSNAQYASNMNGGDGLAVEQHPEARFVSDDIRAAGDGYEAVGTLTVKGRSQPLTLPFTLEIDDDRAVANGSFTIDRAEFGVGSGSWSDVGPSVTVTVHVEADRAS